MADGQIPMASPFAKASPELVRLGYSVVPIGPRGDQLTGKSPAERIGGRWRPMYDWTRLGARRNQTMELEIWSEWVDAGIGIVLGTRSGDCQIVAVDIDLSDQDSVDELRRVLPRSPMAKFGAKGVTLFYRADPDMRTRQWRAKGSRRPFVELLTGRDTRQTVVPPTVHPDTGQPYRWLQGPVAAHELPLLTAEHIEAFEEALEQFGWCREESDRPDVKPLGANVVRGAFDGPYAELNAEAMARLDEWVPSLDLYRLRRTGSRYQAVATWRDGGSGNPPEKRKLNLSIHPAGIKDFGTDETFSPIDLVSRARGCDASAAFLWLDGVLRGEAGPAIDLEAVTAAAAAPEPETPGEIDPEEAAEGAAVTAVIPDDLCFPRGLVGEIARWMVDTAQKPQPVLSLAAALCVVGTVMGRQYMGPTASGTHLYAMCLAPSGSGKDHPVKCARRLLTAAGMAQHMGPGEFISGPAVINTLTRSPLVLSLIDEFGAFLGRINSRKAGGFEKQVGAILRTAWGSSFSPMATPESAQKRSQVIHAPAMSIYGVSTPGEFFASLTGLDSTNGVLNRFLMFPSLERPHAQRPATDDLQPPAYLVEGLKATMMAQGAMVAANLNICDADPLKFARRCPWGPGAEDLWRAFASEVDSRGDHDQAFADTHSRAAEYAIRLATIHAVSRTADVTEVTVESVEWGIAIARRCFGYMLEASGDYIADTDAQARAQEIVRALKARKGRATHRELYKALDHRYSARDVKDALASLLESGRIEQREQGNSSGRATVVYRLT